jgi:hypothetical protein
MATKVTQELIDEAEKFVQQRTNQKPKPPGGYQTITQDVKDKDVLRTPRNWTQKKKGK